jgi:hypothetical protein
MDPDLWVTRNEDRGPNLRAIEVCVDCPVRAECFADAVRNGDDGVIRAGVRMSPHARKKPMPQPVTCRNPDCRKRFLPDGNWLYCRERCRNHGKYLRVSA